MLFGILKAGGIQQAVNTEVMQRIQAQMILEFGNRFAGCDQFPAGRKIDTVVTGEPVRRSGNPHVHAPNP